MYTAIVRSTITDRGLVWWEAMNKKPNKKSLTKIQRLAAIGTMGGMRGTSLAALDVMLNQQPLYL